MDQKSRRREKPELGTLLAPIEEQIKAATREWSFRRRVYPRWVAQGKITDETSRRELTLMRAIVDTLQRVAMEGYGLSMVSSTKPKPAGQPETQKE